MSGQHQIGRDELTTLGPHEVMAALKEGRLDDVLAGRDPGPRPDDDDGQTDEQLDRNDLKTMTGPEITAALEAGRLDHLLGRQ